MKDIRTLALTIAAAILVSCTGCFDPPAPGRTTIAILDGSIQSCLFMAGTGMNSD